MTTQMKGFCTEIRRKNHAPAIANTRFFDFYFFVVMTGYAYFYEQDYLAIFSFVGVLFFGVAVIKMGLKLL